MVRPVALWQLEQKRTEKEEGTKAWGGSALPEIYQAPLYPVILAVVFKITGVSFDVPQEKVRDLRIYAPERVILVFNTFLIFLTVLALYLVTTRMFDQRVGTMAATMFVLSDLVWQFGLSGLATTSLMLLIVLLIGTLQEALGAQEEQNGINVWFWVVASAVVLILLIYTRLSLLWLVIPYLLVLLYAFQARWLLAIAVVGILALAISPWLARNYAVSGSVWGGNSHLLTRGQANYPGSSLERSYDPQPEESLVKSAARKFIGGWKNYFTEFWELSGSSVFIMLFLVSLMHPFRRWRAQILRFFILGAVLFLVSGTVILEPEPHAIGAENVLGILWPGLLIFGCAYFFILLDRLELPLEVLRVGVLILVGIIQGLPLLMTLAPPGEPPFRYPPYFPPMIRIICDWVEPSELMASDMPWASSWYGDKTSLWLPATMKEFYLIHDNVRPVRLAFLTPVTGRLPLHEIEKGEWKEWSTIIERKGLPNLFPLQNFTPLPPENEYLVLSDKVRWR
jgi:hypothetical protein